MEVEWDVEEDCVDDDGGEKVAEDNVGARTLDDYPQRHDRERGPGFLKDKQGEPKREYYK